VAREVEPTGLLYIGRRDQELIDIVPKPLEGSALRTPCPAPGLDSPIECRSWQLPPEILFGHYPRTLAFRSWYPHVDVADGEPGGAETGG
jgi:hypothetical protein